MSEDQLKAADADTDAALEQDFAELSDEELAGVSGGGYSKYSGSNKFKSMEAAQKNRVIDYDCVKFDPIIFE